jgi:hypothetical protein
MSKVPADDVPQEFQKAWLYANGFMADAIKNEEHCKVFLKSVTCWTEEEKEFLFEAWILMKTGKGKAADDLSTLKGMRSGEITLWTSGTGSGKSTLYDYYEAAEEEEEETTKDKKG